MFEENNLSRLDNALSTFFTQRSGFEAGSEDAKLFRSIVERLSLSMSEGNSCLHVTDDEQSLLLKSSIVSEGGEVAPLILDQQLLYWQRYWQYETQLAQGVQVLSEQTYVLPDHFLDLLDQFFPSQGDGIDWQRRAAEGVAKQAFSIVTGGPGTGKTTTVLRILALLQTMDIQSIALVAPTGKAAMRLQESLSQGIDALPASDEVKASIPQEVTTLHQLLGVVYHSANFRHNASNPLIYDVVVADEASMIDLALMSKLIDALKQGSRLILLGDKDQLASVESGYVLADLSQALPQYTLQLLKTWRFKGSIKQLAEAINKQEVDIAWDLLNASSESTSDLVCVENNLAEFIAEAYQSYLSGLAQFSKISTFGEVSTVYEEFLSFQVLCANKRGARGVEGVNALVQQRIRHYTGGNSQNWYHGRPVMITRNDPSTGLYNGDVGICLYCDIETMLSQSDDPVSKLMVFFPQGGDWRYFYPSHLPECETVYAMTIHKSQGSEFKHVCIVLPDKSSPLITKELIYTAVTRAKEQVSVAANEQVFKQGLSKSVQRYSGLIRRFGVDDNSRVIKKAIREHIQLDLFTDNRTVLES